MVTVKSDGILFTWEIYTFNLMVVLYFFECISRQSWSAAEISRSRQEVLMLSFIHFTEHHFGHRVRRWWWDHQLIQATSVLPSGGEVSKKKSGSKFPLWTRFAWAREKISFVKFFSDIISSQGRDPHPQKILFFFVLIAAVHHSPAGKGDRTAKKKQLRWNSAMRNYNLPAIIIAL